MGEEDARISCNPFGRDIYGTFGGAGRVLSQHNHEGKEKCQYTIYIIHPGMKHGQLIKIKLIALSV